MELSDLLRDAASDPPPTRIDVAKLIAGERRFAQRRRWLISCAIVVLVAAITLGVSAVVRPLAGTGPAMPSTDPCRPFMTITSVPGFTPPAGVRPTATEPVDQAGPRLSAILRDGLAGNLPGTRFTDPFSPCEPVRLRYGVFDLAHYYAVAETSDASGAGAIEVMVGERPITMPESYPTHTTLTDGTSVGWLSNNGTRDGEHVRQNNVSIQRPDGTCITLIATNVLRGDYSVATRPDAPATPEQLIAIGLGMTLYP